MLPQNIRSTEQKKKKDEKTTCKTKQKPGAKCSTKSHCT